MHSGSARLDQLTIRVSSFADHTVTISDLDELAHYYANADQRSYLLLGDLPWPLIPGT